MKLVVALMLLSALVRGDGGVVRLREASGPFLVTIFTAEDPLRAGPIDVSALVQDGRTGDVMFDAAVKLEVSGSGQTLRTFVESRQATNKLLKAAWIDLPAGSWMLRVNVSHGGQEAVFSTNLQVDAAKPRLSGIWPLLTIPPFVIGLFALHQMLSCATASSRRAS